MIGESPLQYPLGVNVQPNGFWTKMCSIDASAASALSWRAQKSSAHCIAAMGPSPSITLVHAAPARLNGTSEFSQVFTGSGTKVACADVFVWHISSNCASE